MHEPNVEGAIPLPCVVYAAKSTEDLRGSLITQLEDCVRAIDVAGGRRIAGRYQDEAVSGFSRSRGDGLAAAMNLSATLAGSSGSAELWVQHSDRLARGDGKTARHVVEIALWALKANVIVRCVEDSDTFRDLLHAVVIGERNHEDSRRKGATSAAGIRRGAQRGDYGGNVVDGYRVVVDADERGCVTKRMEFDPARQPLFELIFRLARRGNTHGVIARKLTARGWRTSPRRADHRPMPFSAGRIWQVLANPRYAGLSPLKGEILGPANWPAYITPAEFYARQAARPSYRRLASGREPLAYLLRRLVVCGKCGCGMSSVTGRPRADGSRARRYICHSHVLTGCKTSPIDAEIVDCTC
jgi:DNA invertase Pin-like site-specific DNA recombinase